MSRSKQTQNEKDHGHCADELMRDYDIPRSMRAAVCDEIAQIYRQGSIIHCVIITSVRGYRPMPQTRSLKNFLEQNATSRPKNHKQELESTSRGGRVDSRGKFLHL